MIELDGSRGEGGGQILRTALALALVTGREFQIHHIRARREKPGLRPQHLEAVRAAAVVGDAEVEGATLGSLALRFRPRTVAPAEYHFVVPTAGSAVLLLETILPALATAPRASALVLEGGTHNPLAPPFEFLARTFLPLIEQMGPTVKAKLDRHGFYPAGGGKLRVTVTPASPLRRLDLTERGPLHACRCRALLAQLPPHIGERELKVLRRKLGVEVQRAEVETVRAAGPGNVLLVELEFARITEVFAAFGERGLRAELVADRLAKEVGRYLEAGVPVGEHLADQLLLPMALAGGGSFVTLPLTPHAQTNLEVIQQFIPCRARVEPVGENAERVCIQSEFRPGHTAAEPARET